MTVTKRLALWFIGFGCALVFFASGVVVGRSLPGFPRVPFEQFFPQFLTQHGVQQSDWRTFERVWDAVHEKFVDGQIDDRRLLSGALAGLVRGLGDPYSLYLDAEDAEKFQAEIEGSFSGIGAEIGIKSDSLVIIAPLPASPAERAGLKPRDHILRIDDADADTLNLDEAVHRIRGEAGSSVTLVILSDGGTEPETVKIVRERITVESVREERRTTESGKAIVILRIASFTEKTDEAFAAQLQKVLLKPPEGIILDLRNNPGGYLTAATAIAAEFVGKEPIVIEEFAGNRREIIPGDREARVPNVPVIILINEGTASAAEILAGALQDYDRATVIGEKSFGKGSVQDYERFADGSSLKLTTARWLTPKGRSIEKEGIVPDVPIPLTNEDADADRDPQLDAALMRLNAPPP